MSPEALVTTAQLKRITSWLMEQTEKGEVVKIANGGGKKPSQEIISIDNDPLIIFTKPYSRKKTILCGDKTAEKLKKEGIVVFPKSPAKEVDEVQV